MCLKYGKSQPKRAYKARAYKAHAYKKKSVVHPNSFSSNAPTCSYFPWRRRWRSPGRRPASLFCWRRRFGQLSSSRRRGRRTIPLVTPGRRRRSSASGGLWRSSSRLLRRRRTVGATTRRRASRQRRRSWRGATAIAASSSSIFEAIVGATRWRRLWMCEEDGCKGKGKQKWGKTNHKTILAFLSHACYRFDTGRTTKRALPTVRIGSSSVFVTQLTKSWRALYKPNLDLLVLDTFPHFRYVHRSIYLYVIKYGSV